MDPVFFVNSSAMWGSLLQVRNADIVVSAAGRAGLVKGHWIRPGAVVVDVAINAVGKEEVISRNTHWRYV